MNVPFARSSEICCIWNPEGSHRYICDCSQLHIAYFCLMCISKCFGISHLYAWIPKGRLFGQLSSLYEPGHDKTNKMSVHPTKTQISLGIRLVWSETSLSTWRKLGSLATYWAHGEDSDQTGQIPSLIWVFAGRTLILLVLSCRGPYRCPGLLCLSYLTQFTCYHGSFLIRSSEPKAQADLMVWQPLSKTIHVLWFTRCIVLHVRECKYHSEDTVYERKPSVTLRKHLRAHKAVPYHGCSFLYFIDFIHEFPPFLLYIWGANLGSLLHRDVSVMISFCVMVCFDFQNF